MSILVSDGYSHLVNLPSHHPILCLLPNSSTPKGLLLVLPIEPGMPGRGRFGRPLAILHDLAYVGRTGVAACLPTFEHVPWLAERNVSRSFLLDARLRQQSYLLDVALPLMRQRLRLGPATPISLLGFSKAGWAALSLLSRFPSLFAQAVVYDAPLMLGGDFCEYA